jgi:hypothetical protein
MMKQQTAMKMQKLATLKAGNGCANGMCRSKSAKTKTNAIQDRMMKNQLLFLKEPNAPPSVEIAASVYSDFTLKSPVAA